jgi:hypothetical protein
MASCVVKSNKLSCKLLVYLLCGSLTFSSISLLAEEVSAEELGVEKIIIVKPVVEKSVEKVEEVAPITLEEPIIVKEPVIEEVVEEAPVVEEVEIVEETPVIEEEPIVEEIVIVEPVVEEVVEEAPVVEEVEIVEEVAEAIMPMITGTPDLMNTRPEIFSVGTFLNIDAIGDPEGTHIKLVDNLPGIIHTYKLAKDNKHPERGDWKNVKVVRKTKYIYPVKLKFDNKYEGYRYTTLSIALEKILRLTKHYEGTILLDEYKNYPLWNVALKDVDELRAFIDYLYETLAKRGKKSFDLNPIIRLRLQDDVLLESLDVEDWANLKMLFDVVNLEDTKTMKFFNDTQYKMDDLIETLNASKLYSPGIGYREHLINKVEDYFEGLDAHEFGSKTLAWGAGAVAFWGFQKALDKTYSYCFPAPRQANNQDIVDKLDELILALNQEE